MSLSGQGEAIDEVSLDVEKDPDKRMDFSKMDQALGVKLLSGKTVHIIKKLVTMVMELHPVQSFQLRD